MNFTKTNNLFGWIVFFIALGTYLLTSAKTASFWDCGEFIACAYELQVPHPPGPPVYLLIGRLLSMLSFGNPEMVAFWVNMASVISSAATVLFTFWIITMLGKRMLAPKGEELSRENTIAVIFAGMVGALSCTFMDSFWFNAVEAEVYAMSSTFTAAVVWLMLKWEARADKPDNLKWIIFIAYIIGLSIGVHLLSLLAIPALAMIWYFRKYTFSWMGTGIAFAAGGVMLLLVQYGVIQWSLSYVWFFEKNLVGLGTMNGSGGSPGFGLPVGSGVVLAGILFAGMMAAGIYYSQKYHKLTLNTALLSLFAIMIGYSTYSVIFIRANAEVPVNENAPGDLASMLSYMKREQYGSAPILYGPLYNAQPRRKRDSELENNYVQLKDPDWYLMEDGNYTFKDGSLMTVKKGKPKGTQPQQGKEKLLDDGTKVRVNRKGAAYSYRLPKGYMLEGKKHEYDYADRDKMFFPRMHSTAHYEAKKHRYGYQNFVQNQGPNPDDMQDDRPTAAENMSFFVNYQMLHMYWRYFGWNFIGRESDLQDDGVESGFNIVKTAAMPENIRGNKGKNHYFYLPFLLGLLGLVWHSRKNKKDALMIGALFLVTGAAIILYLNQPPSQPRERDYSYVGSLQTWCIWIGIGVLALYELLRKHLGKRAVYVAGISAMLLVPGIMAVQNWDDHNRHNRYIAPDMARNLLASCGQNGILFTNGDNDTFPLWYVQEVEGFRTDVRVVNLMLANTDWYIHKLKQPVHDALPVPIKMKERDYLASRNSFVRLKSPLIQLPVDKEAALKNGTITAEEAEKVISPMEWTIRQRGPKGNKYLQKQDKIVLEIMQSVAENGWDRPIYFAAGTMSPSNYLNLQDYFRLEGMAYRVVPVKQEKFPKSIQLGHGSIDLDLCYNRFLSEFSFRKWEHPDQYADEHIRNTIVGNTRTTILRTAMGFIEEGEDTTRRLTQLQKGLSAKVATGADTAEIENLKSRIAQQEKHAADSMAKGKQLLEFAQTKFPETSLEPDPIFRLYMGHAFMRLGERDTAIGIYDDATYASTEILSYCQEYDPEYKSKDRYVGALSLSSRLYELAGEKEKAIGALEELYAFTGSPDAAGQLRRLRQ